MDEVIFVYVTCGSGGEAQKIASVLVEKRLVACANIMPAHKAVYRWNEGIETADETAMILKTTGARFGALRAEILSLHSYECPCIVALPVSQGHEPFLRWIAESVADEQ